MTEISDGMSTTQKGSCLHLNLAKEPNNQNAPGFAGDVGGYQGRSKTQLVKYLALKT